MSKAVFKYARISNYGRLQMNVTLEIDNKEVEISNMPVPNEILQMLTKEFKRHLPKPEDV